MKYFVLVFFFYSTAFAGEACKNQVKEVAAACSKSTFAEVFSGAFTNYPYDYKSIFDNLENCTSAVAQCYYKCDNKTVSSSATLSEVTSKLKTSYGDKPHSAEIINCRGSLKEFAVEVDGTCEGQMIKLKSEMDSEDKGLKELGTHCNSFSGFQDPDSESDSDLYGLQNINNAEVVKIEPFKYKGSEVTVKGSGQNLQMDHQPISNGSAIQAMDGVGSLSQEYGRPLPVGIDKDSIGGKPQKQNPPSASPNQGYPFPVVQNSQGINPNNKSGVKKASRKLISSPLNKIKEDVGSTNYYSFDPKANPVVTKNEVRKTKVKQVVPQVVAQTETSDSQWYRKSVSQGSGDEPVMLYRSVFDLNSLTINSLRARDMTIE